MAVPGMHFPDYKKYKHPPPMAAAAAQAPGGPLGNLQMAGSAILGGNGNANYPANYTPYNITKKIEDITGKITSKIDMNENRVNQFAKEEAIARMHMKRNTSQDNIAHKDLNNFNA